MLRLQNREAYKYTQEGAHKNKQIEGSMHRDKMKYWSTYTQTDTY